MNDIYLGKYEHALDTQGRISIPSEWRDPVTEATVFVLYHGQGNALMLFPLAVFNQFVDKVRRDSFTNPALQRALRVVGERTRRCQCDKQGRIKLDRAMIDECGIGTQVELTGAVTYIALDAPGRGASDSGQGSEFFEELQGLVKDSGSDVLQHMLESLGGK